MNFTSKKEEAEYKVKKLLDFRKFDATDIDRVVSFISAGQMIQQYITKGEFDLHRICTYMFLNGIAFGRKKISKAEKEACELVYADLLNEFAESRRNEVSA